MKIRYELFKFFLSSLGDDSISDKIHYYNELTDNQVLNLFVNTFIGKFNKILIFENNLDGFLKNI